MFQYSKFKTTVAMSNFLVEEKVKYNVVINLG